MIKPEDIERFQEKYIQGPDRVLTPIEEFRRYQDIVRYNLKNHLILSHDNIELLPKSIRNVMDKTNLSNKTKANMYYDLIELEQLVTINCLDKAINILGEITRKNKESGAQK